MIVVVGRPGLHGPLRDAAPRDVVSGLSGPTGPTGLDGLSGLAAGVSLAAASAGARVELVGSVGDDPEGDEAIVRLGRAGVGHAAVLRDPGGHTQVSGEAREPLPRLDAGDVSLGLGYLVEYGVVVLADAVAIETERVVADAAAYQGAALIVLVAIGREVASELADAATVLEAPAEDEPRFAELVGRYAANLDAGGAPDAAFRAAAAVAGWERSPA